MKTQLRIAVTRAALLVCTAANERQQPESIQVHLYEIDQSGAIKVVSLVGELYMVGHHTTLQNGKGVSATPTTSNLDVKK